jgi:hypothetical protein
MRAGKAAGHDGDHCPDDHGFVAAGEAFVVAGAAPAGGDPGQGALDDPAAGQDLEGVQVIEPGTIWTVMPRRAPQGSLPA